MTECILLSPSSACSLCNRTSRRSNPPCRNRHVWSVVEDEAVVGTWFAHGCRRPAGRVIAELAELIGASVSSVAQRIDNVEAILATGSRVNAAKMTQRVARRFATAQPEQRELLHHQAVRLLRDRAAGAA